MTGFELRISGIASDRSATKLQPEAKFNKFLL